jgi:hypothetical protein
MTQRKREEIQNALQRKGFQLSSNDHNKFIYFTFSGNKTSVWTKTSFGTSHKDIGDDNIGKMARQCRLNKRDFIDLVDCPLSRQEYENKLKTEGQIAATSE